MINPLVFATVAKFFSKAPASHSMLHAAEPNEFGVMGLLFGLIWQKRKKRLADLAAAQAQANSQ